MVLNTNLKHITSESDFNEVIENNENVMICCGRMGPMCLPVYGAMDDLRKEYPHVEFRDLLFDSPHSHVIRDLPECKGFMGLPFIVYFKKGVVLKATTSIQTKENIITILNKEFHN